MLVVQYRRMTILRLSSSMLAHVILVALVFLAALRIRFLKYRAAFVTVPRVVCRADYALFANGTRVVDAWTSPSYSQPGVNPYSTPFHKPINPLMPASRAPPSIPELALGLTGDPRALWFFDGVRGTLGFALSEPAVIDTVRLNGHLSPGAAPRCLPRDLVVWGAVLPSQLHNLTWSMFEWPHTALPDELVASKNRGVARGKGSTSPPEVVWIPLAELHDLSHNSDREFAITGASVGLGVPMYAVAVQFLQNHGEEYSCFPGIGIHGSPYGTL